MWPCSHWFTHAATCCQFHNPLVLELPEDPGHRHALRPYHGGQFLVGVGDRQLVSSLAVYHPLASSSCRIWLVKRERTSLRAISAMRSSLEPSRSAKRSIILSPTSGFLRTSGGASEPFPRLSQVHAREPEEVLAEDLTLRPFGELRVAVAFDEVLGDLKVPERVEGPFRVPDRGL